jgi:2-polyprenyl-3-methyl-5-hydroxy-6-metoxy-1,4-benzoquinol methylase
MPKRVAVDEVAAHNERMWERLARAGIPYTRPQGTPPRTKSGKRRFLDGITNGTLKDVDLEGKRVLSLAGGGGWDAILFAELGATTTLFDISTRQLRTVRRAATQRGTELEYVRGDMRDLGALGNGEFDIVFHQHSLVFIPDADRVIAEVARVLAPDGVYVFSTMHPVTFLFYESWTGTGWRPKKTYFSDRAVPLLQPTWEFNDVKVHAPTYEYAHRTADLVNACARVGLLVDGLWEWSPSYAGGPAGTDDALERQLPAFIQVRARKHHAGRAPQVAGRGARREASGSPPRTVPPAPPPFVRPPGDSRPSRRRTRAR